MSWTFATIIQLWSRPYIQCFRALQCIYITLSCTIFKKKKVWPIIFFWVNPANSVHCCYAFFSAALLSMSEWCLKPLLLNLVLDCPLITMTQKALLFPRWCHKAWTQLLNCFSHLYIPQNAFAPQIEKQKIWNWNQKTKGHMMSLSISNGICFWALLLINSWSDPPVLRFPLSSGIGSSQPVVHGFHSRMKTGLHQFSKRSSRNSNHISSFTCRRQSKKRQQRPQQEIHRRWMRLTPI